MIKVGNSYFYMLKQKKKMKSTLVEYCLTGRLSEKGQIVLPKGFREEQNLNAGSPVTILRFGNGLLLIPEEKRFDEICTSIEKTMIKAGISAEYILEGLPQARNDVFEELYPKMAGEEALQ